MTAYLRQHKPRINQYRSPRRLRHSPLPGKVTGCTVLHTAEGVMDTVGPDTGAEAVARYVTTRTTFGSYHDIVDSDSIVQLVEYGDEAYQDGTGSNPWALSISFACRTVDWARMSPARRAAFLRQGALAFARQQAWRAARRYPLTQLRLITSDEADAGASGFVYHGVRDPGRRTDPGTTAAAPFPIAEFLAACRAALGQPPAAGQPGTTEPPPAPTAPTEDEMIRVNVDQPGHARHGWTYLMAPGIVRHLNGEEDGAWRHVPLVTRNARQADVMRSNMLSSATSAALTELSADADDVREVLAALPAATVDELRRALAAPTEA